MIVDNSKINKGPIMTYRMFKEYVRGYQNVGASLEDFKNFSRDIKKFLSEGDAQMLIEHFMKIKRMCPSFYFDFEVDEKDVEPAEFEERWTAIVEAHGLSDNEWLQEKYGIRHFWIPAYFRDLLLGRLMRTTSRSESENHFFSNFTNPNLTLVEFWTRFESAMDTQRWAQSKLIAQSKYSFPDLATPLDKRKACVKTYTPRIFEEFKVEIKARCFTCAIGDKQKDKNHAILYIDVKDRERKKDYKVGYKTAEVKLVCNCKKFERHGIICRDILCVLKDYGFDKIPSEYLLNRWSKLATCQPIFNSDGRLLAIADRSMHKRTN
ncbi:protein FAR1-RELATED SEQUENCE 5-like [Silene latifolia]|uniref:protein FAR1-RELATED SEQUENCE 5-like n=1 Tax=Silene latifolia TaxID=37657 RepID=UPI003D777D6D